LGLDAAGTATEARRNARRRRSSSRSANQSQHFAVTSGRTPLGTIDVIDGVFVTYDASGLLIGHFNALKKAVDSLGDGGAS
jgi:hypothetical protein